MQKKDYIIPIIMTIKKQMYHEALDYHTDCPKVNWKELRKFKKLAKRLKANEKDIEKDEFYEEYMKTKPNFD